MCDECGWEEVVADIEDLLNKGNASYSEEFLENVHEWIEENEHCTDKQRSAVERIWERVNT